MVLLALLLIVEVGVVVRDALALGLAAREGARAGVVVGTDEAVREAVRRAAGPLDAEAIELLVEPDPAERRRGEALTVELRYEVRVRLPVVDRFVSTTLPLRSETTMRLERDGPEVPTPSPSPTPAPTPSPSPTPLPP